MVVASNGGVVVVVAAEEVVVVVCGQVKVVGNKKTCKGRRTFCKGVLDREAFDSIRGKRERKAGRQEGRQAGMQEVREELNAREENVGEGRCKKNGQER